MTARSNCSEALITSAGSAWSGYAPTRASTRYAWTRDSTRSLREWDWRGDKSGAAWSSHNLINHSPVDVRQPHIAPVEAVSQLLVIEPEQAQNRRVQFID